ncbi:FAD binding domain-containing protein [Xylariaceae sp. FL0662B]|nr:FAD binding domain-containing protein [Xylariaceae sp. FL0662B]
MMTNGGVYEVDVLVVGSGAAGLTAALTARSCGLKCLIIEKGSKIGGTSSYSGGAVWIPDNPIAKAAGVQDSRELALKYMDTAIGDVGPASSAERRRAFLDNGPEMVAFLRDLGFKWFFSKKGYPDYYPNLPGALLKGGRSLEPAIFSAMKLGVWWEYLLRPERYMPAIHNHQTPALTRPMASIKDFISAIWTLAKVRIRTWFMRDPVSMGRSLIAQLLSLNNKIGVEIWRETGLVQLIINSNDSVIGAKVSKGVSIIEVRAQHGVLLCAAGFARNKGMREKWGKAPSSTEWTMTQPDGDTGDAVRAGMDVGGTTSLIDDSWWIPVLKDPVDGQVNFAVFEMCKPFAIVVDSTGSRFFSEAEPYADAGHSQYKRHAFVPAIPAWLIIDTNHRRRYTLGRLPPLQEPTEALADGRVIKADNLDELAYKISVDASNLQHTVNHWNDMCADGIDHDFGKGGDSYQRYLGDPNVKPNPNMGPITRAPFYATNVFPGDIGTKGGLLTDEYARVLNEDGIPIPGLYAAGNSSATVMGHKYCGAGATIGPAMTFAFIAARHMGERKSTSGTFDD